MDLTKEQEEVASSHCGRVVAIAGPGSGKTRTLVERIRRLQVDAGVHHASICAVTFTVRAASELETRLEAEGARVGFAGTLHGFARSILKAFPDADGALGARFSVFDERDRLDVLRALHGELRLRSPLMAISRALEEHHRAGGDPEALPLVVSPVTQDAERMLLSYRARKAVLFAEDFDGLIDRARLVLLKNPAVAAELIRRYPHLSVDEAQDLDASQDSLLELVAPSESFLPLGSLRSLLFVGDPLQSVYEWRGGDPRILLRRAETAHVRAALVTNFRSRASIVDLSNRIAAEDPLRPSEYSLVASREDETTAPPGPVLVREHRSDSDEIRDLAHVVMELAQRHKRPRDIAILARTNDLLSAVGIELERLGVPFQRLGARRERIANPIVRGAVSYAEVAINPANDHAIARALETPAVGLERGFFSRIRQAAGGGSWWAALAPSKLGWTLGGERSRIERVVERVASLFPNPQGETLHAGGWSGALDDVFDAVASEVRAAGLSGSANDVEWLRELLGEYVSGRVPGRRRGRSSLSGFVWWLLFGQGPGEHDPELDAVTLSTVHLAKGLEWDVVFVPGLIEPGFPTGKAIERGLLGDPSSIDEERRVFFVACSRAKECVVLSHSKHATGFDGFPSHCERSRFLRYAVALGGIRG